MKCLVQDSMSFADTFLDMKMTGYTFFLKKLPQILVMRFSDPGDAGFVAYFFNDRKDASEWAAKMPLEDGLLWDNEFYIKSISYDEIHRFVLSSNKSNKFDKRVELFVMADDLEGLVPYHNIRFDPRRQKIAGIGRNQPCICGSGKKWKKCCMKKIYIN